MSSALSHDPSVGVSADTSPASLGRKRTSPLFRHETNGKVSHDVRTGPRRGLHASPLTVAQELGPPEDLASGMGVVGQAPRRAAGAGCGAGPGIVVVVLVLYFPVGALIVENIDDDPQFAPRNVAPGESRRRGGGAARHPRGRRQHLDADDAVLRARRHPRQHAELPARHHGGARSLQHRIDGSGRPDPSTSRVDADLEQAHGFSTSSPTSGGSPASRCCRRRRRRRSTARRTRPPGGLQQATGVGAGRLRATRRQPAGSARPSPTTRLRSAVIDQHIIEKVR